jgi:hypothetical protein
MVLTNTHGDQTMLGMAKRKKPNRKGVSFSVWLPADVNEALERAKQTLEFNPDKRAIIVAALRDYLPRKGIQVGDGEGDGAD